MRLSLAQLQIFAETIAKAVGCFKGTGRLEVPDYDRSDHARFLVPGDGPLEVVTIDSYGVRGGDVAIKIDVEGGELEALKGAVETIRSARNWGIIFGLNPQVAKRPKRTR